MSEWIDAWVTRYALTSGIFKIRGIVYDDGKSIISDTAAKRYGVFRGDDWHDNLDNALAYAEVMRQRRIDSLSEQIEQLKTMKIQIDES